MGTGAPICEQNRRCSQFDTIDRQRTLCARRPVFRRVGSRVSCMWLSEMAAVMQASWITVARTRTLMITSMGDLSNFSFPSYAQRSC